jgi:putative nucleotidyltransferase with HDIG domain
MGVVFLQHSNGGHHQVTSRDFQKIEPQLKEILYRFLEEVRATKAALYLSDDAGRFDLVTQYGFRDAARPSYSQDDDLIDRLVTRRSPFYLNGLGADPRFSELLYEADTSRMLVAPIYSRGKLVGMVDLRDKARQEPFEQPDVAETQKIVDHFLEVFAAHGLFGQRSGTVSQRDDATQTPSADGKSSILNVIDQANAVISRGALRRKNDMPAIATEDQTRSVAVLLPAVLSLPAVVAAALTPVSRLGGAQIVSARAPLASAAMDQFEAKIRGWIRRRGEAGPAALRTSVEYPFGADRAPIDPARLVTILSAGLKADGIDVLALSVAFDSVPETPTRLALEKLLAQMQQLLDVSFTASKLGPVRQQIAEMLLQPDLSEAPLLVAHSRRVAELAEKFAGRLGMPAAEIETIRLAALVHDVGMRLLDYRSLYRKESLTSEEMRILRSHPSVGAALVASSPLGPEVGRLVLSHHERPDGTGYPDRLFGDQIPPGSKIIHICEAFDAMTASDSYQPPVAPSAAAGKIRRAAGTQFDQELAIRFSEMIT